VERRDISDVCEEYGIHPNMFYRWQKQFFENGERAFRNKKDTHTRLLENKVSKLEKKLTQKNDVLSELMQEHVALKKSDSSAKSVGLLRFRKMSKCVI